MEIKFNDVSYAYDKKTVLCNINTVFKEKTIYGICGVSGSGKTTLAELLNALILPTEGNIKIGGRILSKEKKIKDINDFRSKIGLVFQFPEEQFFNNTVEKEIEFGIENFNKKVLDVDKHIKDALSMVDLDESYLKRNPQSLSSGEMRKVAIASILAFNPKVIVLDDPTIGLDNKSKENLIKIIRLLKERYNKTVIILSNDTETLHKICNEIIVLKDGKIVLSGSKYEVFTSDIGQYGLKKPKIIEFEQLVYKEKGVKMLYRDDINDLMKDVYRHVK